MKNVFFLSKKGSWPYDFCQPANWQCYQCKFSDFIVSKSDHSLKDVYYFWHMFKLLMFQMKFGKVGWPGLAIQLSKISVVQPIQMNKLGLLRHLVKVNILSTISLLLTNCDSFSCDKIIEEGWLDS